MPIFVHKFTSNQIQTKIFKNQTKSEPKQVKQFCTSLTIHKCHLKTQSRLQTVVTEWYLCKSFTYSMQNSLICLEKMYTLTQKMTKKTRWTYVIGRQVQSCYVARCPSGLMNACQHRSHVVSSLSVHK